MRTMGSIKSYLYAVYMERGEEGFEKKARELSVEGEQREEILGEIKKTAGEIYETRDGQDYIKALAERARASGRLPQNAG